MIMIMISLSNLMILQVNVLCPVGVYLCDGSVSEAGELTDKVVGRGMLVRLDSMDNCYLCRTDPADVARVESKTFLVTPDRYQARPLQASGHHSYNRLS